MAVQVNVRVTEQDWKKLRDLAEARRWETSGRANVSALVASMVKEALQRAEQTEKSEVTR